MRMLVTGGGGFLGLYIVEQLLAAGHDVRVFCRGTYPPLTALDVPVVNGDLRDRSAVEAACADRDAVFHSAAVPGVWGSWEHFHGTNTIGTHNVISGCRRHAVRRLIYTSSPSVVFDGSDHVDADERLAYPGTWLCHYPRSKALAEQAVLAASDSNSLRTVSLRPHLIWGRRDNHLIPRLIARARSGQLRRVGDGRNIVSVSYVENAAAAHLQAEQSLRTSAAAAGRAYFINEPQAVNLWDWVGQLLGLARLPPVTKSISASQAAVIGGLLETVFRVLHLPGEPPMTRFLAAQLSGSHSYSIAAAQRDFQYQPVVSMEAGLQRLEPDLVRLAIG